MSQEGQLDIVEAIFDGLYVIIEVASVINLLEALGRVTAGLFMTEG